MTKLLSKTELIMTSGVDHADWNYSPLLAYVMRRRFALVLRLLPQPPIQRILEIGFGSGVFMPELAARCSELYGVDVHSHVEEVQALLERRGIPAALFRQDAAHMQFPKAFFDVIVSVSALEFIEDVDGAAREAARVLKPQGRLVAAMPAKLRIMDFALRALTGADPKKDYGTRRESVIPAFLRYFRVVRTLRFAPVYTAYELEPRNPR